MRRNARSFATFVTRAAAVCVLALGALVPADPARGDQNITSSQSKSEPEPGPGRSSVTFGALYGGSLLGFDREVALGHRWAFQFGAGLIGADVAVNLHMRPDLRSNYVSVGLWDVGLAGDYVGVVTTCYGIRWKRLAGQLGLGFNVFDGGHAKWVQDAPTVGIVTSLGICSVR